MKDSLLFRRVDASGLAVFRICFGLLMLWEMIYLLRIDFVEAFLELPQVQFSYPGFGWLHPLPEDLMQGLIIVLALCCVLITLGKWFKPAVAIFALGFSYIFLLDKAYYNNHLYLLCLLSFLLIFIDADKRFSLEKKKADYWVPIWQYRILQAQLFIVYFYGGIAKINADWLIRYQPTRLLMKDSFFVDLLGPEPAAIFLSYGGLVFDLAIGFLLLWKPTRTIGVLGVLFFNISNAIVFDDINIFPYFMICATILFADPDWTTKQVRRIFSKVPVSKKKDKPEALSLPLSQQRRLMALLGVYLLFQVLFPFRHWLIPGNTDWTGEGQRFSWRMKIQYRHTEQIEFEVLDYDKKTIYPTDLNSYKLNRDQIVGMSFDPEMTLRFAHFLAGHAQSKLNSSKVGVKVKLNVAFNGRKARYLIDPETDLAEVSYHPMRHNEWILPLAE